MSAGPRLARRLLAESAATQVLRANNIEGPWVDPIAIAKAKGIEVRAKPDTADGVSGMLLKAGDEFGILYATKIPSRGFQRFSVAHELGHYCIEGHSDALLDSGMHISYAGFQSSDPYEQEADHFAAALLMPERAFKCAIDEYDAGLACVEALSKQCETSLTATAIRYVTLTADGVAVLLTKGDGVEWCFMSDGLRQAKGLRFIRKGAPVPDTTLTASFNTRPDDERAGQSDSREAYLNDWMGGDRSYRVTEEVIGLGRYGRSLTILTCKGLSMRSEADEDEEDEDKLIESWTPRFK
ncbi:ImmA/IrrE family metallo-endopeptidase [Mesorhizobium sp. M0772]|uniref:ImmA/IrrE family metallo-endopeptidase n=1 Tax=Mesorhizobium sp. M0772 TaxID=2956998 RepID=UPI00333A9384